MKKFVFVFAAGLCALLTVFLAASKNNTWASNAYIFNPGQPADIVINDVSGTEVFIDGMALDAELFQLSSGSLTLPAATLYTLSSGQHTLNLGGEDYGIIVLPGQIANADLFTTGEGVSVYYSGISGISINATKPLKLTDLDGSIRQLSLKSSNTEYDTQLGGLSTVTLYNAQTLIRLPYADYSTTQTIIFKISLPLNKYDVSIGAEFPYTAEYNVSVFVGDQQQISFVDNPIAGYSGSKSLSCTGGDMYLFVDKTYGDNTRENRLLLDLSITPSVNNVAFFEGGQLRGEQTIPYGYSAMPLFGQAESWFSDEDCTAAFDFSAPVTQYAQVYYSAQSGQTEPPAPALAQASIEAGNLIVTLVDADAGQYQFWVKTFIDSDIPLSPGAKQPFVWYRLTEFCDEISVSFPALADYLVDGCYNVIVRAKYDEAVAWEQLYSFTPADAGAVAVDSVRIDDNPLTSAQVQFLSVDSVITAVGRNFDTLKLYIDEYIVLTSLTGQLDLAQVAGNLPRSGVYGVKVEAYNSVTKDSDTIRFNAAIEGSYDAGTAVVVRSLSGKTIGSNTVFIAKIAYQDESYIDSSVFAGVYMFLQSELFCTDDYTYATADGGKAIELTFNLKLGGTGIIFTTLYIRDTDGNIADFFSFYYRGNVLESSVAVQSSENYSADLGHTFGISALGSTAGGVPAELYAFYREDAGGYSLLQGYSENSSFSFKPMRTGSYIIQVRVKTVGSIGWEAECSKVYTVNDSYQALEKQHLSLEAFSLSGQSVNSVEAGSFAVIKAQYTGSTDVLYKFLIKADHMPGSYLTSYSVSGEVVFHFYKSGTYTFTVRVIQWQRYSYLDIFKTVTVVVP